ncbi:MAG: hypothetical protein ACRDP6_02670 [Actinoallomurus sp.]
MSQLDLLPQAVDLSFTRGDTVRFTFSIKDSSGAAVDVTGASFLLTVDPSSTPADSANNLFQLSGSITDAPGGVVQFHMTSVQSDQDPGEYAYDLQMTDSLPSIRTIARGKFTFEQDVTK